jgi:uncharacterized protein YggE
MASYAGLTRVSITLRKKLSKWMDGRVKPGNDEGRGMQFPLGTPQKIGIVRP